MSKSYKGGDLEREIAKRLSRWWSASIEGEERDDIFWRTSQSGGRATQRKKGGKSTSNSYGDIAAVDPIGVPLLKVFTIELKRGDSHGNPGDLFDALPTSSQRPFEAALIQAIESHRNAKSFAWLLISRRDRRIPLVFVDWRAVKRLKELMVMPFVAYRMYINFKNQTREPLSFGCLTLEDFLFRIKPEEIIRLSHEQT